MTGVQFDHPREMSPANRKHDHNGTIISSNASSTGSNLQNVGYALLPLWLTILFFIFFVASGKLIL